MNTNAHDLQAGDPRSPDFPFAASAKAMNPERRQSLRQSLHSLVYLDLEPSNGGIVLDLGEGGMRISLAHPLMGAEDIRFSLCLQPRERIRGTGRIAWISDSGKKAGVRFVSLPHEALGQIRACLGVQAEAQAPASDESEQHEPVRSAEADSTIQEAETVSAPVSPPPEIADESGPSILSLYDQDGPKGEFPAAPESTAARATGDIPPAPPEEREGARAEVPAPQGGNGAAAGLPESAAGPAESNFSLEGFVEDSAGLGREGAEERDTAVIPESEQGLAAMDEAAATLMADDAGVKAAEGEHETPAEVPAPRTETAAVVAGGGEEKERKIDAFSEADRLPVVPRQPSPAPPPPWLEALIEAGHRDRWEDVFPEAERPKKEVEPEPPEPKQTELVAASAMSDAQPDVPAPTGDSARALYLPNYQIEADRSTGDVHLRKFDLHGKYQMTMNLAFERLEEFGWTLERDWHIWMALVLLVAGFLALAQKPPLVLIAGALWVSSAFVAVKRKQKPRLDETFRSSMTAGEEPQDVVVGDDQDQQQQENHTEL